MEKPSLDDIKTHLLLTNDPRKFLHVSHVGSGLYRDAFCIGDYVVKKTANHGPCPVEGLAVLGIDAPEQWFVKDWVIQPYYKMPIPWEKYLEISKKMIGSWAYDLHDKNLGTDKAGNVVAFDW